MAKTQSCIRKNLSPKPDDGESRDQDGQVPATVIAGPTTTVTVTCIPPPPGPAKTTSAGLRGGAWLESGVHIKAVAIRSGTRRSPSRATSAGTRATTWPAPPSTAWWDNSAYEHQRTATNFVELANALAYRAISSGRGCFADSRKPPLTC
jgi:hypothetical protein